jgi:membrane protein YqaA with SNARE-associated domain
VKIFSKLYDKALLWSKHQYAVRYLGGLSFAESSFFPIPPDVMLAPMSLATPNKAWYYAMITTLTSVAGGLFGYLIGYFAFSSIEPYILQWGYQHQFEMVNQWFAQWGIWVVFLAGFSPIPYKLFTITAGLLTMSLLPFLLASAVGRGARFFMVAGLMRWGGEKMELKLREYIDRIGWILIIAIIIAYFILKS